jgi:hypothetical protein
MAYTDLLSVLKQKYKNQDSTGFNYFDFLHAEGSPFNALFYSQLFWPEFIEIDGMVFLRETIEDNSDKKRLYEALDLYEGDKIKTEQSFNLVEIPSLFGKNSTETTEEEDMYLADRLAEMWRCKLAADFTDREFVVKVLSPEETGGELALIFYRARKENKG